MKQIAAIISIFLLITACGRTEEVEAIVTDSGLPRIIDLGSESCIPCKAMQPELENLRTITEGYLDVMFIDVNIDRNAASTYQIRVIPTQIFFSSEGVELARHEGFIDAAGMLEIFRDHGIELAGQVN